MNKYNHISDDVKQIIEMDNNTRIKYIKMPTWVDYPKSDEAIDRIRDCMTYPEDTRVQSLLIIGDSNMGKTSIINNFRQQNPSSVYIDEGVQRIKKPVILATTPSTVSEKNLYAAILRGLNASFSPTGSVMKLEHQVYTLIAEHDVQILIIDEIHHLLESTIRQQKVVLNAIKNITNVLKVPIIAVGIESAKLVFPQDEQLVTRFTTFRLPKWELDENFAGILQAFETELPLQKRSNLYGKEKSHLLYHISEGNLGNLLHLLRVCAVYAITNNIEEITMDIIKQHSWACSRNRNPSVEIPL